MIQKLKHICIYLSPRCKLSKRAVQLEEHVSEAVVCRLQIRFFLKILQIQQENICVGVSFSKAAALKACNSIEKRLQHRCFPVKFAEFLRKPFCTEEFQWLLLKFNSCFQRCSGQKPVRLSAINTRFSWKKIFAAAKMQKQPP